METLVSAGGVVYRESEGRIEAVLCGRAMTGGLDRGPAKREMLDNALAADRIRWSLAKGTPDEGETLEQTALREVREETGLEVEMDSALGAIEYWFVGQQPDVRFHKTVHFYLMVPIGGDTNLHDPEFDVVRWFSSDEALKTLAYANEVEVLRRALAVISGRRENGPNG